MSETLSAAQARQLAEDHRSGITEFHDELACVYGAIRHRANRGDSGLTVILQGERAQNYTEALAQNLRANGFMVDVRPNPTLSRGGVHLNNLVIKWGGNP
jgi:hypothetical protein